LANKINSTKPTKLLDLLYSEVEIFHRRAQRRCRPKSV